jgi:hypothetical protein
MLAMGTTTAVTTATAGRPSASLCQVVPLPDGFRHDGIATGRGHHLLRPLPGDGAIYRGNLLTGRGSGLHPGTAGKHVAGSR